MTTGRWNVYERVMLRWSHYEPDYSLLRPVRDSTSFKLPRAVFWLQWPLYAAAIDTLVLAFSSAVNLHPSPLVLWLAAIVPLLAWKIYGVLSVPAPRPLWHRWDPLDWLHDVGVWGSVGAFISWEILAGYQVPASWWAVDVVLFVLLYAWSSP